MFVEKFKEILERNLGDCYCATRVWSAWSAGTMTEDDFTPLWDNEEFKNDVAVALQATLDELKPVVFYSVGAYVRLRTPGIFANVTAVMIRGDRTLHEVVWWENCNRHEAWVETFEIEAAEPKQGTKLGLRGPDSIYGNIQH